MLNRFIVHIQNFDFSFGPQTFRILRTNIKLERVLNHLCNFHLHNSFFVDLNNSVFQIGDAFKQLAHVFTGRIYFCNEFVVEGFPFNKRGESGFLYFLVKLIFVLIEAFPRIFLENLSVFLHYRLQFLERI